MERLDTNARVTKALRSIRVVFGIILLVTILGTGFLFISVMKQRFPLDSLEWAILGFVLSSLFGLFFLSLKVIGKPPEGYAEKLRESISNRFKRTALRESLNGSFVNILPVLAYLTLSIACTIALIGEAESDPKGHLILMQIPLMFPLSVLHLVPWAEPFLVDLSWQRFFLAFIPLNSLLIFLFASFLKYLGVTLFLVVKWLTTILLNRLDSVRISKRINW